MMLADGRDLPHVLWDGICDLQDDGATLRFTVAYRNRNTLYSTFVLAVFLPMAVVLTLVLGPGVCCGVLGGLFDPASVGCAGLVMLGFLLLPAAGLWLMVINAVSGSESVVVSAEGLRFTERWRLFPNMYERDVYAGKDFVSADRVTGIYVTGVSDGSMTVCGESPRGLDVELAEVRGVYSGKVGRRPFGGPVHRARWGPRLYIRAGYGGLPLFAAVGSVDELERIARVICDRLGVSEAGDAGDGV